MNDHPRLLVIDHQMPTELAPGNAVMDSAGFVYVRPKRDFYNVPAPDDPPGRHWHRAGEDSKWSWPEVISRGRLVVLTSDEVLGWLTAQESP